MADFLYDLPRIFYENGVVTDGKFDEDKATELGYGPAQFEAIKKFLGLPDDTPTQKLNVQEED
jgi:hypothetical protein